MSLDTICNVPEVSRNLAIQYRLNLHVLTLTDLQQLEEENKQIRQEKEDLESEVLSHTSKTAESELTSLKRIKRDMELKIEELEDELDEVNLK